MPKITPVPGDCLPQCPYLQNKRVISRSISTGSSSAKSPSSVFWESTVRIYFLYNASCNPCPIATLSDDKQELQLGVGGVGGGLERGIPRKKSVRV